MNKVKQKGTTNYCSGAHVEKGMKKAEDIN